MRWRRPLRPAYRFGWVSVAVLRTMAPWSGGIWPPKGASLSTIHRHCRCHWMRSLMRFKRSAETSLESCTARLRLRRPGCRCCVNAGPGRSWLIRRPPAALNHQQIRQIGCHLPVFLIPATSHPRFLLRPVAAGSTRVYRSLEGVAVPRSNICRQ